MFALYQHQAKVIDELREGFLQGHKRQVLAAATGFGKTVVAAHLAMSAVQKGKKVLFIVDRVELVAQAARTFSELGLQVGILQGENTAFTRHDDVIVASIQTIRARRPPDWVHAVLIDECHILHRAHTKLMERWNALPFIGLSATPLRRGLGKYFTNLVRGPSVKWLTENGFLVPCRAFAPGADEIARVLDGVSAGTTKHGFDYNETALGRAMNQKELVGDIVGTWRKLGENRPTLCFACSIAHSQSIAESFAAEGVTVAHLDAYTRPDERREAISAFRAREIQVLASVSVLSVGFDAPEAACLILARPTLSEALHMQQLGRGIRRAEGKADCIVLDHAGNTVRHSLPVHFEVPDLDDGTAPERGQRKAKEAPKMVTCRECGYVLEPDQLTCPNCGIDRPRKGAAVKVLDGDLVEFGERQGDRGVDFRGWYLAMLWWVRQHGKADGKAYYMFKARFGRDPEWGWRNLRPIEPTPEQARWIKGEDQRSRIAWAKRRRAA